MHRTLVRMIDSSLSQAPSLARLSVFVPSILVRFHLRFVTSTCIRADANAIARVYVKMYTEPSIISSHQSDNEVFFFFFFFFIFFRVYEPAFMLQTRQCK